MKESLAWLPRSHEKTTTYLQDTQQSLLDMYRADLNSAKVRNDLHSRVGQLKVGEQTPAFVTELLSEADEEARYVLRRLSLGSLEYSGVSSVEPFAGDLLYVQPKLGIRANVARFIVGRSVMPSPEQVRSSESLYEYYSELTEQDKLAVAGYLKHVEIPELVLKIALDIQPQSISRSVDGIGRLTVMQNAQPVSVASREQAQLLLKELSVDWVE